MHSSFITLGVVVGSWIGGMGINEYGLRAPLRVGAGLAVLAVLAMIPAMLAASRSSRTAQNAILHQRDSVSLAGRDAIRGAA